MANIRLVDNTWDTSGVYDRTEEKTQDEINAGVKAGVGDLTLLETEEKTSLVGAVNELQNGKADQDGNYPNMTVGNAEQLVATVGVDDNAPYNFRTTGGNADVGDRKTMEIVGGTIAWNQLVTTDTNVSKTKSGDIVTVEDAVAGNAQGLVVNFEPQQDLHGQDAPYPAGGGQNLLDPNIKMTAGTYFGLTLTTSNDGYSFAYSGTATSSGNITTNSIATADAVILPAGTYITRSGTASIYSASGSWLKNQYSNTPFTMNEPFYIKNFYFEVVSGIQYNSSGFLAMLKGSTAPTEWSPYSNICPITGWTGCEVWNDPKYGGLINWNQVFRGNNSSVINGVTITLSDNNSTVTLSGTATGTVYYILSWYTPKSVIGHVYYVSRDTNDNNVSIYNDSGGVATYSDTPMAIGTATAQNSFFLRLQNGGTYNMTIHPQIIDLTEMFGAGNEPSTVEEFKALFPKDYYPYNAGTETTVSAVNGDPYQHISVTFPDTVYGCKYDFVSGVMTVDRAIVDLGTINYNYSSGGGYFYASPSSLPGCKVVDNATVANAVCSAFHVYSASSIGDSDVHYGVSLPSTYLRIKDARFTDATAFKTAMSGVQLVYEVETPTEISLTPQQIALLAGTNNVWNSIGSTQMTYLGTLNEITAQSGHKYLTRVNGVSTVVNGSGQTLSGEKGRDNIFDLTQMFGSAIADYVYSLENTTAGNGVAWFRHLFPKPYYAYNAGELMSVNTSANITRGFNAWDEQWEKGTYNTTTGNPQSSNSQIRCKNDIPMVGGSVYYCYKGGSGAIWGFFLDANKTVMTVFDTPSGASRVGNAFSANGKLFTAPEGCRYFRFYATDTYGSTYGNNICINLSWDGERDGEYEAYEEHVYPLDESLTLRGIPKLDSGNNFYYDGDTYESDGTVTRKYAAVDLGTLTWNADPNRPFAFYSSSLQSVIYKTSPYADGICDKYVVTKMAGPSELSNKSLGTSNAYGAGNIFIRDSSFEGLTPSEVKAALSGVYFHYQLANQATESADPYQSPQIINDFGTEEFVDYGVAQQTRDVAVPVGHNSVYASNLRAKLEMAPDSPDGDGDYIVRQTDGENEYVPLIIPNELPEEPSTDGTYHLQLVIASGEPTLSWVSAT